MRRTFRHWTARYIFDRVKVIMYERTHRDSPWLSQDMIKILESWLKPTDIGFEWGSGRSTVWFAKRIEHLTSVEHDPVWADKVRAWLIESGCDETVDYRLEVDADLVQKPDARYVHVIDERPDKSLDFCLVDGWQRVDCCLAALPKIKPGGVLILDNAQLYIPKEQPSRAFHARYLKDGFPEPSEVWRHLYDQIKTWRCVWTTNGTNDTALYVKEAL